VSSTITILLAPAAFNSALDALSDKAQGQFPFSEERQVVNGNTVTSGSVSDKGVSADYSYDGVSTLTITITHKPLLVTEGYVESKIRAWFAEAPKEG
jgi:hypothetical protein